jgi:actin-related protein 3
MGFGGNAEPSFLIPTAVASADSDIVARPGGKEGISDMEYFVGEEAVSTKMYQTNYPIQHGKVRTTSTVTIRFLQHVR